MYDHEGGHEGGSKPDKADLLNSIARVYNVSNDKTILYNEVASNRQAGNKRVNL